MMSMEKNIEIQELNIQPQAGVIGVFSRLNYKPWYAIAEFVDNSTQSFYSHQQELADAGINDIVVSINYDVENDVLIIMDTAFGMEIEDFARAVKIDSPPDDKTGRNEFGMGLKTAASWFGNIWSVRSTQFGSNHEYYTEINIPELRSNNINSVTIKRTIVDPSSHGTTIIIREVTKKIGSARTKNKITELLKSMYRRDLNNGLVRILYDGEPLFYDEYDCLSFRNQTWRKNIDFKFEFDGHNHHVVGFVGILAHGGFGRAGFALFRRNRVVVGGEEFNYKPDEIFGQAQSTIAHKLFGELDLDDFPINQAKDGFVWDDGLEEEFINQLKIHIKEYIEIAKITNKDREKEESTSKSVSDNVQSQVQDAIEHSLGKQTKTPEPSFFDILSNTEPEDGQSELDLYKEYQAEQNNQPEVIDDKVRTYPIQMDGASKCTISVRWTLGNSSTWIKVDAEEDGSKADIQLNINHPFFKPYSEKEDFKSVLEKFAIAFALAEIRAKRNADAEGRISPNAFRTHINNYLRELTDE
ncbi:MAG: hypothetical protein E7091_05545 [Bacteroidales bacterium]|nr:hypothetical protein [Bacteroidales bacterium]